MTFQQSRSTSEKGRTCGGGGGTDRTFPRTTLGSIMMLQRCTGLFSLRHSTQRPLRPPPTGGTKAGRRRLLGQGAGPGAKARGAAARGRRHSPRGGMGLLSVLGAGGQEAGVAGEAVGHAGGHHQLGRSDGHHGGLRLRGGARAAVTASVSRATRRACARRQPRDGSGWEAP